jgi:hypothetical protein
VAGVSELGIGLPPFHPGITAGLRSVHTRSPLMHTFWSITAELVAEVLQPEGLSALLVDRAGPIGLGAVLGGEQRQGGIAPREGIEVGADLLRRPGSTQAQVLVYPTLELFVDRIPGWSPAEPTHAGRESQRAPRRPRRRVGPTTPVRGCASARSAEPNVVPARPARHRGWRPPVRAARGPRRADLRL